jgi:hypothetical protein
MFSFEPFAQTNFALEEHETRPITNRRQKKGGKLSIQAGARQEHISVRAVRSFSFLIGEFAVPADNRSAPDVEGHSRHPPGPAVNTVANLP